MEKEPSVFENLNVFKPLKINKPERIVFEEGVVFGLDFINKGQYVAEIHSNTIGNSPSCIYLNSEKIYKTRSGEVYGKYTEAQHDVFLLDLQSLNITEEDLNSERMNQIINENRDKIQIVHLDEDEGIVIPPRILHQFRGIGIMEIFVPNNYDQESKFQMEKDDVSFVENNGKQREDK